MDTKYCDTCSNVSEFHDGLDHQEVEFALNNILIIIVVVITVIPQDSSRGVKLDTCGRHKGVSKPSKMSVYIWVLILQASIGQLLMTTSYSLSKHGRPSVKWTHRCDVFKRLCEDVVVTLEMVHARWEEGVFDWIRIVVVCRVKVHTANLQRYRWPSHIYSIQCTTHYQPSLQHTSLKG